MAKKKSIKDVEYVWVSNNYTERQNYLLKVPEGASVDDILEAVFNEDIKSKAPHNAGLVKGPSFKVELLPTTRDIKEYGDKAYGILGA